VISLLALMGAGTAAAGAPAYFPIETINGAPVPISGLDPAPYVGSSTVTLTYDWTVVPSAPFLCFVDATAVDCGNAPGTSTGSFTASNLADGKHSANLEIGVGANALDTNLMRFYVDTTPPDVTVNLTGGTLGSNDWYTSPPDVSATASDPQAPDGTAGSGVASTDCTLNAVASVCSPTLGSDGTYVFAGAATDKVGNEGTNGATIFIDGTAPTVTCPAAPTFVLGSGTHTLTATVTDPTSGPASATVSGNASTSVVGPHSVSLTGYDNAGNSTNVSCPYQVVYNFMGFASPISNAGFNTVKAGQAVPIKFGLGGQMLTGNQIAFASAQVSCTAPSGGPPVSAFSKGSSGLTYNPTTQTYSFSWATIKAWAGTCRELDLNLDDGTTHKALFQFTK
jgi:hypothetical protein